jgi:hypothetical protein
MKYRLIITAIILSTLTLTACDNVLDFFHDLFLNPDDSMKCAGELSGSFADISNDHVITENLSVTAVVYQSEYLAVTNVFVDRYPAFLYSPAESKWLATISINSLVKRAQEVRERCRCWTEDESGDTTSGDDSSDDDTSAVPCLSQSDEDRLKEEECRRYAVQHTLSDGCDTQVDNNVDDDSSKAETDASDDTVEWDECDGRDCFVTIVLPITARDVCGHEGLIDDRLWVTVDTRAGNDGLMTTTTTTSTTTTTTTSTTSTTTTTTTSTTTTTA